MSDEAVSAKNDIIKRSAIWDVLVCSGAEVAVSTSPKRLMTPEEYLAIERDVPTKHEFHFGEMFGMGGASTKHNQINFNLATEIGARLKNRPCVAFLNDMRVKIPKTGSYVYPDLVVTCDQPQFEDKQFDTLLNPQVVIEVISDSTELFDRGRKFEMYMSIESVREYLLVGQNDAHVSHFQRDDHGAWTLRMVHGLGESIEMPSIDCKLSLADVYAKVEFPPIEEVERAAAVLRADQPR